MRKALIGAFLLPLPFAALPVVAMLFGGSGGHSQTLVVQSPSSISFNVSTLQPSAGPLAYGVTTPGPVGCDEDGAAES